jgi:molybdopterin converting factor small subunit
MASVVVSLPAPFHRAAGGQGEVHVEGNTVAAALAALRERHPAAARLFLGEAGEPRRGVSLLLNGTDLRSLARLETPLRPGDRLEVVLLMAGG